MPLAAIALVLLLQPSGAGGSAGAGARAGAFGTARPAECGLSDGFRASNPWERAKEPNLRRYCDLLASGTAKLVGAGSSVLVKDVPAIADEADRLLPGRASPSVLKGRALLRLGRAEDAVAALVEAKKRDDRALDDPVALLAWARANARTGKLAEAAQAYRAALPRTSALSAQERSAASFEAGMTVMAEARGATAAALDDAVAMFRQARRDAQDAMQVASVAALALALDRSGQREEARAVFGDRPHGDMRLLLGDPRVVEALADAGAAGEADALVAIALETQDPPAAKDAWRKYLEGPGGKAGWAAHAREHAGAVPAKKPARGARGER